MITLRHAALDCRVFYKEARTLCDAGYEVHYINRLSGEGKFTDMGLREVGQPDENGGWRYEKIIFHGIRVRPKTFWGKYQEFREIVNTGLKINADVYHCHETDIALIAAIRIKKKLGSSTIFVFDSHEYWTGVWAYQFFGSNWRILMPFCKMIEKFMIAYTEALITSDLPTHGALQQYNLKKKILLLYNAPVISLFDRSKIEITTQRKNSKIKLVHEGSLSSATGINRVLEFLEGNNFSYVLEILGKIIPSNKEEKLRVDKLVEERKIEIRGWIEYIDVGKTLACANIGLSLREDSPNHITAAPNKLFNYMYAGLPIIADNFPGMADIIEKYQCGILVQPNSSSALKQAIEYLLEHPHEAREMGERGRMVILTKLNWERHSKQLLDLYSELFEPQPYKVCNISI